MSTTARTCNTRQPTGGERIVNDGEIEQRANTASSTPEREGPASRPSPTQPRQHLGQYKHEAGHPRLRRSPGPKHARQGLAHQHAGRRVLVPASYYCVYQHTFRRRTLLTVERSQSNAAWKRSATRWASTPTAPQRNRRLTAGRTATDGSAQRMITVGRPHAT